MQADGIMGMAPSTRGWGDALFVKELYHHGLIDQNMFAFNIPANKVSIGAYSQNYNVVWHQNKDDYLWAVPLNKLRYGSKIEIPSKAKTRKAFVDTGVSVSIVGQGDLDYI